MKWSLQEAKQYADQALHITKTFQLDLSLTQRFPKQVLAAQPVQVDGYLSYERGDATLSINVKTTITVPSSRSLAPVELPLDFDFTETYIGDETHRERYDRDEIVFTIDPDESAIDLDNALVENIFEQIPSRVLTEDEKQKQLMPHGKGWTVISDQEHQQRNSEQVDPRLAKLKNLFPDQDEKH